MSFPDPDKATPVEVREMLTLPDYFGIDADHPVGKDHEHWTLGPGLRTRDSDLLTQVNADALEKALGEHPEFAEDYLVTRCSHWGFGWVEHLSFRVLTPDGQPTAIWRWLAEWFGKLSDYPCADDDALSRREMEATVENIEYAGRRYTHDNVPDDWSTQVYQWLADNAQREVEPRDGRGGCPGDEAVRQALKALNFYDTEDDED